MTLISDRWMQRLGERVRPVNSISPVRSISTSRSLSPPSSSPPQSLNVSVTAPGRFKWQGSAQSVTLPSPSGEFGILTGYASLTACLDVGVVRIRVTHDQALVLVVLGGFVRVEGDEVTILAAGAEPADGLEPRQTLAAVEAAEADLHQAHTSSTRQEAQTNLRQAHARWQAACFLLSCSALSCAT